MSKKHLIKSALTALICILTLASIAFADNETTYPKTFGIKGGFIAAGTAHRGGAEYDLDAGYDLGFFLDYKIRTTLYAGFSFDLHQVVIGKDEEFFPDLSFTMKASFGNPEGKMFYKVGGAIGYGFIKEILQLENAHLLTAKAVGEMYARLSRTNCLIAEIGVLACPLGGNKETRLTAGPILILRLGITL